MYLPNTIGLPYTSFVNRHTSAFYYTPLKYNESEAVLCGVSCCPGAPNPDGTLGDPICGAKGSTASFCPVGTTLTSGIAKCQAKLPVKVDNLALLNDKLDALTQKLTITQGMIYGGKADVTNGVLEISAPSYKLMKYMELSSSNRMRYIGTEVVTLNVDISLDVEYADIISDIIIYTGISDVVRMTKLGAGTTSGSTTITLHDVISMQYMDEIQLKTNVSGLQDGEYLRYVNITIRATSC